MRIDGLLLSREAWARAEALTAQPRRAGILRARSSCALDLLVLHPEVAARVLAGGCRVYRCATCGAWLDAADGLSEALKRYERAVALGREQKDAHAADFQRHADAVRVKLATTPAP
ncbi:hypothetical protein [Corallococcus sp. AB011P]|uniref:hypothetical protein n=1 Tax=Corallococcus sp. AB011P TaxID=2316735 RepID=UPI0018F61930|nr:hypothetical protein [Corallococcus sp. AB011P]